MPGIPKWKRFENLVAQVQKGLAGEAKVTQTARLVGRHSAVLREVDILIEQTVAQYELRIAIDCKDHAAPVDVKLVEEFIGLVEDIGANKGAIVAANGFSAAAKAVAKSKGIDLYKLIDAENTEWRTYVSIPVIVNDLCVSWRLGFQGIPEYREVIPPDGKVNLYNSSCERIGCTHNLVGLLWESGGIPEEPGQYDNIPLTSEKTYIRYRGNYAGIVVKVSARVELTHYFCQLPLESLQGFADEIEGGVVTRGFKTAPINFAEMKSKWRRLERRDELAIQPLMELGVKDAFEPIAPEQCAG